MEESMSMSGFCINKASTSASAGATGTKCGRWNPTSEQVKVLTDLFHSGLRTPSTDQIQKISSQLSFYGKIESKNVFYWFQNHKARERQKRRKVISVVDDNIDKDVFVLKQDHKKTTTVSSPKRYAEICHNNNHNNNWRHDDRVVSEPERVIETLQLFPLSSFGDESGSGKLRFHANHDQCCREKLDHPPLDLRLSFL